MNESRGSLTPSRWNEFKCRISMKNIILFTPVLLMLVSCGPTAKEKEEIAILTCNILESSVIKDGVFRLNEVNDAREEIGEDRFSGTDNVIRESLKVGLCKELVLNEKNYEIEIKDAINDKYKEKGLTINQPHEEYAEAEILITFEPSGEILMNGSRIDISAAKENLERIMAENPAVYSVVISVTGSVIDTEIVVRLMDAARMAGVYDIDLR